MTRGPAPPPGDGDLPDHGLPDDELPDRAVLERIWRVLSRWAVPVMMTLAYILLAATSDTNAAGKTLMAGGLALVFLLWFVFRSLTESAALSRALDVGDVPRLLALADRHLPRTRHPAARARFLVARALAHQLRGDFTAALTALDEVDDAHPTPDGAHPTPDHAHPSPDRAHLPSDRAHLPPDLEPLARVVRLAALIELGRQTAALRALPPSSPRSPALASLADGQLALSDGNLDTARQRFARVIDDIRAGSATRAIAHLYAARTADARGDQAAATHHRSAAAALAVPDATWLRTQVARATRAD